MWRSFLLMLLVLGLVTTGCSGCDDVATDENQSQNNNDNDQGDTPRLDMGGVEDASMAQDMFMESDGAQEVDMRRERRDMPISGFDFGVSGDMALAPLKLTSVTPPQGSTRGGERVRIDGEGLTQETQILFDNIAVPVTFVAGSLLAITPNAANPGRVSVKALREDAQSDVLVDGYRYVEDLRIDSVSPPRVPVTGGVVVDITGQGFEEDRTLVSLGTGGVARVDVLSSNLLRVLTAPHPKGVFDVTVTTPQGRAVLVGGIEYFVSLELDSVIPASGLVAGGNNVTIRGAGFGAQTKVLFDGVETQVVSRDASGNQLEVIAPPHAAGFVPVTVITELESKVKIDGYFYREDNAPRLFAVTPNRGPLTGGQEVLVTGVGLDASGREILFGDQPATVVSRGDTFATVQTPPGTALGAVDVTLAGNGANLVTLPGEYTYVDLPTITAVMPPSGPTAGGQEVILSGTNLGKVEAVVFGGIGATITNKSDTSLTLQTPRHAAGTIDVVLEQGEDRATKEGAYQYVDEVEIWGFKPTRGALAGGTYIEVFGRGFEQADGVTLDGVEGRTPRRSGNNTLTFYSPPATQGPADVELAIKGQNNALVKAPYTFQYYDPASLFGGASGGSVDGSVNVSVYASGGAPIANAFVMLSTRPDTRYQGWTNAQGQITLSGPEVLGSQTVSATAAGYSTATIRAIDSEDITLFLNRTVITPSDGNGGNTPPPRATIEGRVTTAAKLSDPANQSTYDMAVVATTSVNLRGGNPNPGSGSIVFGEGNYRIQSRIGDLAVVVLCGVYNNTTEEFDPQYMGVERFLSVADQQTYKVDILCNIPLEQRLSVKLVNPTYSPQGPDNNVARAFWDFGFEGYFQSPVLARGLGDILTLDRLPKREGLLQDIDFTITAGSYTNLFSPYSETSKIDLKDLSQTLVMPPLLDVPEAVSPLPGGVVKNREIRWQAAGPYPPDMVFLILRNGQGLPVWTITVPGSQTSVQLPEFPDFSGVSAEQRPDPYTDEQLFLTLTAVRIPQFNYDQLTYEDLTAVSWEARALTSWAVRLRE